VNTQLKRKPKTSKTKKEEAKENQNDVPDGHENEA